MDQTPESSDCPSIQERIRSNKTKFLNLGLDDNDIAYGVGDYYALVDASGRAIIAKTHDLFQKCLICVMPSVIWQSLLNYYLQIFWLHLILLQILPSANEYLQLFYLDDQGLSSIFADF